MRMAYKCRADPYADQAAMLGRTFGCVRLVWNKALDARTSALEDLAVANMVKTCSECGHVVAELPLSVRAWSCPDCRTRHDRDLNAAKNILAAGRAVARANSPGDACGADVRRQGSSLPQSAMNQEHPRSDPGRTSGDRS